MHKARVIFLDLDDTLYPQTSGLWEAIGERILSYMTDRVGIAGAEADRLRAKYLHQYGTTLNGLREEHHIDPHDYLDYVHDVSIEDYIHPDPVLKRILAEIQQKRVIFTNASPAHAQRVLHRLGIEDHIDDIIDIVRLDFVNKPSAEAYTRALAIMDESDPSSCVLVDDRIDNLLPGAAMGMATILVGNKSPQPGVHAHIPSIARLQEALQELGKIDPSENGSAYG